MWEKRCKRGFLIIISGPSGVGKGTLIKRLLRSVNNLVLSVSATTRKPRKGEKNGVNYHFIDKRKFINMIDKNGFLEYTKYNSNYYGTPKESVYKILNEGKNVILEIDVQGAFRVKSQCQKVLMIFVMPPCLDALYKRLKSRNTETTEDIEKRIKRAKQEISLSKNYDYVVVNDSIKKAEEEIRNILIKLD